MTLRRPRSFGLQMIRKIYGSSGVMIIKRRYCVEEILRLLSRFSAINQAGRSDGRRAVVGPVTERGFPEKAAEFRQ